jgi:glucosamine 6-phosphate synthetase-like amidotransferase/phosphosugar isomerase protein
MCGIAGFALSESSTLKTNSIDRLRQLTTDLLLGLEDRGKDAAGIATMDSSSNMHIYKKPVKASEFVERTYYKDFLKRNVKPSMQSVILHTRAQMKGSKYNNENNHPVVFGDWAVVHNGYIQNDVELFKEKRIRKPAEVDTVAIPMALHTHLKREYDAPQFVMLNLKQIMDKDVLIGTYAIAALSTVHHKHVFLARVGMPLWYGLSKTLGLCIFASKRNIAVTAMRNLFLSTDFKEDGDMPEKGIYTIDVSKDVEVKKVKRDGTTTQVA